MNSNHLGVSEILRKELWWLKVTESFWQPGQNSSSASNVYSWWRQVSLNNAPVNWGDDYRKCAQVVEGLTHNQQ